MFEITFQVSQKKLITILKQFFFVNNIQNRHFDMNQAKFLDISPTSWQSFQTLLPMLFLLLSY